MAVKSAIGPSTVGAVVCNIRAPGEKIRKYNLHHWSLLEKGTAEAPLNNC